MTEPDIPDEDEPSLGAAIIDCIESKCRDRVQTVSGPFVGHSGLCTQVSLQQVGVLLLMFKAQRQVRLRRDAVELV